MLNDMKKLLLPLIFLIIYTPAMSQGWVVINGTVTDLENGYPIPNHAVTIMSDSTNGVFYYNVVYTDSVGFYYDDITVLSDSTGILYVYTLDCQNYLHQAFIIFSPNSNTYTQDFQICNLLVPCQALFTYSPEPQGSPDSFQFTDLSIGINLTWYWSFGDSTSSKEQNPFHAYPGPGTFEACLTITGNNCTNTYCDTIVISDTVYQQIYGQVFAGNFPLQMGSVNLFALNPDGSYTPFGNAFPVDSNGIYYFTLVPEGIYLIQAIPFESSGYLPTYYGDLINWQGVTQLVLGIPNNPYNIDLIQAGQMTQGTGSVSGQINNGNLQRSVIDRINMLLMNESGVAIGFSGVSNSGSFDFPAMDYGTYYLRAELPGVASDNMMIVITPERPHIDIDLTFTGNSILGLEDPDTGKEGLSIYPNPVSDRLNISFSLSMSEMINIEIYNMNGQLVYHTLEWGTAGQNLKFISFNNYPSGLYTLRLYSRDGFIFIKKIVRI